MKQTARRGIQRLRRSGLESVVQAYTFDAHRTSEPWQGRIEVEIEEVIP